MLPPAERGVLGTPLGPFWFEASARGVRRCGFGPGTGEPDLDGPLGQRLRAELDAYLELGLGRFLTPLDETSWSPFQARVYRLTREIPRGETRAYSDLGAVLESGARAVGRALAALRVHLLVPAHRVVRADGSLGGYQGQEWLKARLLDLEAGHVKV